MLSALIALLTIAGQPAAEPAAQPESEPQSETRKAADGGTQDSIVRIEPPAGEDVTDRPGPEGPLYRAGEVFTDTKLPVGYPRPTPPGAIEIKTYPSIRQAEVSGDGDGRGASRSGFMPLFRHISDSGIAMTAPVEMAYDDTDGDERADRWTMAFLYHTPEDGPTRSDGRVEVVDTEPVTVVAIGIRGGRDFRDLEQAASKLDAWLGESAEWDRAGSVRRLGYNGPNVPIDNRWWEVQIPIRPAGTPDEGGASAGNG